MRPTPATPGLVLVFALALGACSNVSEPTMPHYRRNPHPQQRYEITLRLDDAPGPVLTLQGAAQYEVTDLSCVPELAGTGVRPMPRHSLPATYIRTAANRYVIAVHADAMRDEDYHGLGVCRWKLAALHVSLHLADREHRDIAIDPTLPGEALLSGRGSTLHFWRDGRPRVNPQDAVALDYQGPRTYREEIRADVFSVTFIPRASTP
ncbi:hypothetical protein [Lysobacter sp. ESA13C]|uniref:hypothetical protein n=1 Tax=unclassified Lysobacter TaxID=2635362 RepID=UPI001CBF75BB|nr:hypothetical protein [Lysobacter sp. ESA13C]